MRKMLQTRNLFKVITVLKSENENNNSSYRTVIIQLFKNIQIIKLLNPINSLIQFFKLIN